MGRGTLIGWASHAQVWWLEGKGRVGKIMWNKNSSRAVVTMGTWWWRVVPGCRYGGDAEVRGCSTAVPQCLQ
eukprot:4612253-Amphidinium_carterae.1